MEIKNTQIVEELNLPPVKIHCSVLAEDAIKSAIADYKAKRASDGTGRERQRQRQAQLTAAERTDHGHCSQRQSGRRDQEGGRQRARRPPKGLRVGIRGGGCTGFSYLFEWSDSEPRAEDKVLAFEDGAVRVFIDPKSYIYLDGSTLEYATTMMGRGFKFVNPNVEGDVRLRRERPVLRRPVMICWSCQTRGGSGAALRGVRGAAAA